MAFQELTTYDGLATSRRHDSTKTEPLSFYDLINFLRRNSRLIGVSMVLGLLLGILYVVKTPSSYEAYARLVIDPEQSRILSQDAATGTVIIEAAEIASQVEIVKSEAIADSVIRSLGLLDDPEIINASSWYGICETDTLFGWELDLRGQLIKPDTAGRRRAHETHHGRLPVPCLRTPRRPVLRA
jgi:polysaccharide biosynthesis transport protein